MSEPLAVILVATLAFILAIGLCRAVMALGVVDAPTEARKTQAAPVLTVGGLGVALAAAIAILVITQLAGWPLTMPALTISGAGLAALALGFADDTMKLPPLGRLLSMFAIALAMCALGVRTDDMEPWPGMLLQLPVFIGLIGSVLWVVVLINAVNFMDGANGLAMGMAAICAAGLAASAVFIDAWYVAILAGALSGALGGFLVWNIPGRLFVGDTGAYFVGAVLAGLSLELVRLRPDLLFVPPILLMPFLSDVILTVLWRTMHGKKIWEAHRDHTYQIALKARLKHSQVALIHAVFAFNAAIIGIVAAILGQQAPLICFVVLLGVSTWLHLWVRKLGVKAGLVGAKIA